MKIKLDSSYHNKLINNQISTEIQSFPFDEKELYGLQKIGLEILSECITALREFSHSNLVNVNPGLHRTIVFAVNDKIENIPGHFHTKELLKFNIKQFLGFTLNLEHLLKEEGLSDSRLVLELTNLIWLRKKIIGE